MGEFYQLSEVSYRPPAGELCLVTDLSIQKEIFPYTFVRRQKPTSKEL